MTDSANSRKLQIAPEVDAGAVRPGVEAVKQAVGEIGQAAQRAGEQGAQGISKIGEGGEKAAAKVERDTRSLIASIERATAAFKAGQKGGSDYFEELARQRGISGDAIKPYVEQLRAAEQAQKAASQGLGTMQVSAAQTAAALRGVPAQFTDIVTALQGGQQPLTVFLQQGGQLRDMFGGAGAAAKALGGYVLSLINPFTVAAAAAGGLAFAYAKGAEEAQAFQRTLILTGNQVGATADQLARTAAGLKSFSVTQAAAADAINQLAATGKVGADNLGRFADAAIRLEQVGGPAVESTVKSFAELGKSPLQGALKLDEATNFLTESVYKQIKALEEQGRTVEAAKVAQEAYAAAVEQRIPALAANLGTLEKAWLAIKNATKAAGDAALNIGRPKTLDDLQKELADAEARLESYGGRRRQREEQNIAALRQQIALQADLEDRAQVSAQQDADSAKRKAALAEFDKIVTANLSNEAKLKLEIRRIEELGIAAGKTRFEIETQIAAAREKADKNNGADNELAGVRAKIAAAEQYQRALKEQGAQAKELTEGEKLAAKIREDLTGKITASERATLKVALAEAERLIGIEKTNAAIKRTIDLAEQDAKTLAKQTDTVQQQADAILDRAKAQEAANAVFGLGKVAVEELHLAELERQRDELADVTDVNPAYLAALQLKIDYQKRYVEALRGADFKQINAGLDEWLRSANEQRNLFESELALAGLTRVEREKVIAARQVELKLAKEIDKIDKSSLSDDDKERERAKARTAAQIESSAAVAKVVRDDWNRTSDQIEQALTDALMRGFDSGKSFASNLRDAVVNMFKTLVLKPVVQAVVQPFAGAATGSINSLLGSVFGAGGSAGGLGSLVGSGGGLGLDLVNSSLGQMLGLSSVQNIGGNLIAGPTSLGNSLLGSGGSILGYGAALYNLSQGNYGSAAGTAIGTALLPGIGSIVGGAIGSAIDKAFGSAGTHQAGGAYLSNGMTGQFVNNGGYGLDRAWGDSIGKYFSQGVQDALKASTSTGASLLNSISTAFGGAGGYQVGAFFASDNNRASQGNRSVLGPNGQILSSWSGSGLSSDPTAGLQQLTTALAGDVRTALQQIDIPGWAKSQLQALTGDVSFEQLAGVVQNILVTKDALKSLGDVLPQLANLSDSAVEGLLKAFNGIDGLKTAASSYYENFYTDAEKSAQATAALTKELASFGLSVPGTREAYRALVEAQDLSTESGRAAYAELLKLSPAFAALVPATQALVDGSNSAAEAAAAAAAKMAEAGRKVLADLADQAGGLQVDLLRVQGQVAEAAALERQRALAKLTEGLTPQDAAAAAAAYDYNAALKAQVEQLQAAAAAQQQAAQAEVQRVAAIEQQRSGLQDQLDQLLGNTAALRERELAALDPSNRAILQRIYAIQDEQAASQAAAQAAQEAAAAAQQAAQAEAQRLAAVASERAGLEGQLLQLLGDTAELRRRELAALDPSNRAILERIFAIQDEQSAAQAAAQAAQELAAAQQQAAQAEAQRQAALASEREGLITRLLQAQGNTAELRERELAALDPTNRALLQQIYALQDQQAANEAAAQAAQQAAQAAAQLRQQWQSVADGLVGEVRRIRGLMGGGASGSLAATQAQFAITTAQARAGDQEAAKLLPSLSEALLALAQAQYSSATDLRLLRAQTAASLNATAQALAGNFGLTLPRLATGTNEVPQDMLAVIHKGEAVVPKPFNPALSGGSREQALLAEIRGLREDQRVQSRAMVKLQSDLFKLHKLWNLTGLPETRPEVAA